MSMSPRDDFERDIHDIIPERFDADADSRQARAGHRLRSYLTLGVAVVAVGAIVATGLHFMGSKKAGGPGIPVIKADERPIKIRPDDRGGMQVPNQDKLVYERMEQGEGEGDSRVERLLPPPEQPQVPVKGAVAPDPQVQRSAGTEVLRPGAPVQPQRAAAPEPPPPAEPAAPAALPIPLQPPVTAAAPHAAAPPPPSGGYVPTQARVTTAPPPPAPAPVQAAAPVKAPPPPAPPPVKVAAPAPAPAPVKVAPPKPAAPPPAPPPAAAAAPKPLSGGDWLIQLSALRSAADADKEWGRIQRANHDLMGALKSDVVRVELGEKGTFWRLRAGPLSEQSAKQLCNELKARNQGCIVARK